MAYSIEGRSHESHSPAQLDGFATDVKIAVARRPDIILPPRFAIHEPLPDPSEYVNTEGFFTSPMKVGKNTILVAGQQNVDTKLNLSANTYLVGRTLIDPGSVEGLPQLIENLWQLGMNLGDIDQILITHLHDDHSEAAQEIQAKGFNGNIYTSAESKMYNDLADGKHAGADLLGKPYIPFLVNGILTPGAEFIDSELLFEIHKGKGAHTDDHIWITVTDRSGHVSAYVGDIFMGAWRDEFNPDPYVWDGTNRDILAAQPDEIFSGHMPPELLPQRITTNLVTEITQKFGRKWTPLFPLLPHTMLSGW